MFVQLCRRCGVVIALCSTRSGASVTHTECTNDAEREHRKAQAAHIASLGTDTPLPAPIKPAYSDLAETRTVKQSNEAALMARVAGRNNAPVARGAIDDLLEQEATPTHE